jgi:hypothetical protein
MSLQIGEYDHKTGQNIVRDMTSAEVAAHKAQALENAKIKEAQLAEKDAAKIALLASLNITEAQAITLGLLQAESSTAIITDEAKTK